MLQVPGLVLLVDVPGGGLADPVAEDLARLAGPDRAVDHEDVDVRHAVLAVGRADDDDADDAGRRRADDEPVGVPGSGVPLADDVLGEAPPSAVGFSGPRARSTACCCIGVVTLVSSEPELPDPP